MTGYKVYFKVRADSKNGRKISVPGFGAGSRSDESLMAIPKVLMTQWNPTAKQLKQLIFQSRYKLVDLYVTKDSRRRARGRKIIDVTQYGNSASNPLLFVDRNDDDEESEEEEEESEAESIERIADRYTGNGYYPGPQSYYPPVQTGNLCGDSTCGRTHICPRDYNRQVRPLGYPGV